MGLAPLSHAPRSFLSRIPPDRALPPSAFFALPSRISGLPFGTDPQRRSLRSANRSIMRNALETLEIEPAQPAAASVIWMHGLGADAHDFYSVPPQLGLPAELSIRYIFPRAPRIPVTINMGLIMRAWYDVSGLDARSQDEKRIRESAQGITGFGEPRGGARGAGKSCRPRRFFPGRGDGVVCGDYATRKPSGGIMCLSGYLPLHETLADEATAASRRVSIFQAHGTQDPVLPYEMGRGTADRLTRAGYEIDWHEYPMAHQVCGDELRDICDWLTVVLDGAVSAPTNPAEPS